LEIAIVAGEASGDLHGALLARALRGRDPALSLWGIGGERMRDEGVELFHGIDEMAVLGFAEVAGRIPFFLRLAAKLRRALASRRPAALVLIDYPGFNLHLARAVRPLGIPVAYYVSPQVWAWGAGRVNAIRESVDRMIVILPFERAFYAERGVDAAFVGHPLVGVARPSRSREATRSALGVAADATLVGLFPGSRRQEVERHLPLFVGAVGRLRDGGLGSEQRVAAAIGRAGTIPEDALRATIAGLPIPVTTESYDLMAAADLLFVASGTATLEAAIVGTPMVVVYRTSPVSFALGRLLVRVPHVALANLVAGERLVPELIQREATPAALAAEAAAILRDPERQCATRDGFARIRTALGEPGAPDRAAEIVLSLARASGAPRAADRGAAR